jgi:hypothetical protein
MSPGASTAARWSWVIFSDPLTSTITCSASGSPAAMSRGLRVIVLGAVAIRNTPSDASSSPHIRAANRSFTSVRIASG